MGKQQQQQQVQQQRRVQRHKERALGAVLPAANSVSIPIMFSDPEAQLVRV